MFAVAVLRRRRDRRGDPQGAAPRSLPRIAPRRSRSHPAHDHRDRRLAAAVAGRPASRSGSPMSRVPSPAGSRRSSTALGTAALERAERALVWIHLLLVLGFLVYLPGSKHLHIVTAAPNVWLSKAGPGGRLEPLRIDLEGTRGRPAVRRRRCDRPHPQADARPVLVHGMRPLPGRLPRVGDREAAQPEAADHGAARPRRRRGRRPARSSCSRWCRTPSPTRSSGTA